MKRVPDDVTTQMETKSSLCLTDGLIEKQIECDGAVEEFSVVRAIEKI